MRNRLDPDGAMKLVRCFSNLNLLARFALFLEGQVEWDDEMLCDEAVEEQMVLRSGSSPSKHQRT